MSYQGSYATGDTVFWLFATTVDGVPTTFSGSPALSVYKNSTTQTTTGVTLTVDYDGVTGMNQVIVDTSSDTTFYATEMMFSVMITTGTVGGKSVVGRPVGYFTLEAEIVEDVTGSVGSVTGNVGGTVNGILLGKPRIITPGNRY